MATRKKSKSESTKTPKKARAPKAKTEKTEQPQPLEVASSCESSCPQDTKQFFSKLLAIYGNKYYILLLGTSLGFVAGVVIDHLFIKC
jgi:hypothetical protein